MKLITTDDQVRHNIPNVLVTVEGEATLLEKLTPFIEQAEKISAVLRMKVTTLIYFFSNIIIFNSEIAIQHSKPVIKLSVIYCH